MADDIRSPLEAPENPVNEASTPLDEEGKEIEAPQGSESVTETAPIDSPISSDEVALNNSPNEDKPLGSGINLASSGETKDELEDPKTASGAEVEASAASLESDGALIASSESSEKSEDEASDAPADAPEAGEDAPGGGIMGMAAEVPDIHGEEKPDFDASLEGVVAHDVPEDMEMDNEEAESADAETAGGETVTMPHGTHPEEVTSAPKEEVQDAVSVDAPTDEVPEDVSAPEPAAEPAAEPEEEDDSPKLADLWPEVRAIADATGAEVIDGLKASGDALYKAMGAMSEKYGSKLSELQGESSARLFHLRDKASQYLAALESVFSRK